MALSYRDSFRGAFIGVDSAYGSLSSKSVTKLYSTASQKRNLLWVDRNALTVSERVVGRQRPFKVIAVFLCTRAAAIPTDRSKSSEVNQGSYDSVSLRGEKEIDVNERKEIDEVDVKERKEIDEHERRRRERIALANKGKTPWNKGRKHTPATIARIRERNRQVMQDPRIREKLRQHSHPQSDETKEKLRRFMKTKMEAQRRQFSCVEEWKESIAEGARLGGRGEEELQWESYMVLKQALRQEHFAAIKEKRKRQKFVTVRAWSLEQRIKISESIRAKWDDPIYRQKVNEGMREFHKRRGHQVRKKSNRIVGSDDEINHLLMSANTVKDSASTSTERSTESTSQIESAQIHGPSTVNESFGNKVGSYSDPLAKEKLERIKQLRARNMREKGELMEIRRKIGHEFQNKEAAEMVHHNFSETAEHEGAEESQQDVVERQEYEAVEQAQREATERARVLMAEAERAAIVAAKAMEAAGTRDEGVKSSLMKARTLLDEANRSIRSIEAGNLVIK